MAEKRRSEARPERRGNVLWQQPLLLREEIQANYEKRDTLLRSLPELEAAFSMCWNDPSAKGIHVSREAAQDALGFYNLVVKDGRYIELLKTFPEEAARKLGVEVKPPTIDVLKRGLKLRGADSRVNEFTVVTAIVATIALAVPEADVVVDHSKHVELKV